MSPKLIIFVYTNTYTIIIQAKDRKMKTFIQLANEQFQLESDTDYGIVKGKSIGEFEYLDVTFWNGERMKKVAFQAHMGNLVEI